jgi:hypothetical protein
MFDRKAWAKAYYQKKKEHMLAKNKEWREANKAEIAIKRSERRKGDAVIAAKKKAWQEANKEKVAEYNRKWKQSNRDRHNALNMKRHAAKMNRTPPWLTKEHYDQMKEVYNMAKKLSKQHGIVHEVDHIVPLQGDTVSGLHVPWNLQILEAGANIRKKNKLSLGECFDRTRLRNKRTTG